MTSCNTIIVHIIYRNFYTDMYVRVYEYRHFEASKVCSVNNIIIDIKENLSLKWISIVQKRVYNIIIIHMCINAPQAVQSGVNALIRC